MVEQNKVNVISNYNKESILKEFIISKYIILVIILFYYYYFLCINNKTKKLRKLNSEYSEIIITISGSGEKYILSEDFTPLPDEIIINGVQIYPIALLQNLEEDLNTIIVRWYNKLNTCQYMFYYLRCVTKVDLSNFDASNVNSTSNMFYSCTNLEFVNFTNFQTSSLLDMSYMFFNCKKITSLDLSSFNTSKVRNMFALFDYASNLEFFNIASFDTSSVTNMKYFFMGCEKLTSIDLSHFRTPALIKMGGMFHGCESLVSLNLSSFDTSKVENFASLFFNCTNLEYINLTNFKTKNGLDFRWMFSGCKKLTSLDISNFDLSSALWIGNMFSECENLEYIKFNYFYNLSLVNDINNLFSGCKKLKSLDLSFLDTSLAINLDYMFYNCIDLQYLNIPNLKTSNVNSTEFTFAGCKSLKILNIQSFVNSNITNLNNTFNDISGLKFCLKSQSQAQSIINILEEKNSINDCTDTCFSEKGKLILEKNICVDDCSKDDEYIYEYQKRCYNSCNNYYSYNKKECLDEIPNGYYLNSPTLKTINKCPNKCQLCSEESMKYNLCLLCNNEYSPKTNNEEYKNNFIDCIKICPSGYININNTCKITKINNSTKCDAYEFLTNKCDEDDYNLINKEDIIIKIKNGITNKKLKTLLLNVTGENKQDIEIYQDNIKYQITSSYNQNNKQYNNISKINISECEKRLKTVYNIPEKESLIIFKVDINQEGYLIPQVEYEIYNPLTLEKLELDECNNITIEISLPVSINEDELFIYNSSSDFYNDKCCPYTSENGTDMTITDRQINYVENNLSLCETNCQLVGYDNINKYVFCDCEIKNEITISEDVFIDKEKLLSSFVDLKSKMNLGVMKCSRILFTKDGLIKNIGSYIILFSILFYIVSVVVFIMKEYNLLINQINNIIKSNFNYFKYFGKKTCNDKNNLNNSKKYKMTESIYGKEKMKKMKRIKTFNVSITPLKKNKNKKMINSNSDCNVFKIPENINLSSIVSPKAVRSRKKYKKKLRINNAKTNLNLNLSFLINNVNELNVNNAMIVLNDYELNSLDYIEAIKFDKRTYFQYYFSLLRAKQTFLFSFYPNNDYNSRIIKIFLFIFAFDLYYTTTALFFTEFTIHKIHADSGKFDFIYNLPQTLLSSFISTIINMLIRYFSLSEKNVLEFKQHMNKINYKIKSKKLLKCLKIKFFFFFIFSFLFLALFWYYLSSFCAVYRNSQKYLIQNTIVSFGLSLIYPIGFNLIPGMFRIPSLKDENKNKKCIYDLSKIMQFL